MEKTTLKNLGFLVNIGAAELITGVNTSLHPGSYEQLAISNGVHGVNGLLIKNNGNLYAIIGRTPALFYYLR